MNAMRWIGWLGLSVAVLASRNANAQIPTAVAEERVDVNGDGRLDVIRIEEPATLSIRITGAPEASVWKPFATGDRRLLAGRLDTASGKAYGDRTVIVAVATFGKKRAAPSTHTQEALVVAWQRARRPGTDAHPHLVEVWRGAVGPKGRDREWSLHVEATPNGLLRYQRKPGVTRCDGAPPYLFPEAYDWKHKRFRPIKNLVRVKEDVARLQAKRQRPEGIAAVAAPAVYRARAASAQGGAGDAGELAAPREIDDGDPATVWRDAAGGDGRGEFITFNATMPKAAVRALRIVPGDTSSAAAFREANRLKSFALLLGDERTFWIDFPRDPSTAPGAVEDAYWVELPEEVETSCATVVIGDVYRPRRSSGETAIAELELFTAEELTSTGPFEAWAAKVADGGAGARASARALRGGGAAATSAVIAEVERHAGEADAQRRLRALLAEIGDPAGAPQIVAGLSDPALSTGELRALVASLARMAPQAIPLVRELLLGTSADDRTRRAALEILVETKDADAAGALIDAVGIGSRAFRRSVAIALGTHAAARLTPIVEAAAAARREGAVGREADLWRAVGILAGGHATSEEVRSRAGAVLADRLASATEYELRYRLLAAAGACNSEVALAALRAALRSAHRDAQGIALTRVAAAALSRNPSPTARSILEELAVDADPGVRKQVATALGGRDDGDDTGDRTLAGLLGKDRWPMVRRATAGALGRRCGHSQTAARALEDAVEGDRDTDVRIAALSALADCRAAGAGDLLLKIADATDYPTSLRVRAAVLIGALGDRRYCKRAVELFEHRRRETWNSEPALRIASAAAGALGVLRCHEATRALVGAASDDAFPELQAAALTALGRICPRDAKVRDLFDRLARSGQGRVGLAARSARHACARKAPK